MHIDLSCRTCKATQPHTGEIVTTPVSRAPRFSGSCNVCHGRTSRFVSREKAGAGFDGVKLLNKVFPGEHHQRLLSRKGAKASFSGPGTDLGKRLIPGTDTPHPWSAPKSPIDRVALTHDLSYRDATNRNPNDKKAALAERHAADRVFVQQAQRIIDTSPNPLERADAKIAKNIVGIKLKFGLGVDGSELTSENALRNDVYDHCMSKCAKPKMGMGLGSLPADITPAALIKRLSNAAVRDTTRVHDVLKGALKEVGRPDLDIGKITRELGTSLLKHALSPQRAGNRPGPRAALPTPKSRKLLLGKVLDKLLPLK